MEITPQFLRVLKWSFFLALGFGVIAFLLSYYGIHGISYSHPRENTPLRLVLNRGVVVARSMVFWFFVGYLTKDYRSMIVAMALALLYHGILFSQPLPNPYDTNAQGLPYLVRLALGILPFVVIGLMHFRNVKALYFILIWAAVTGIAGATSYWSRGSSLLVEWLPSVFGGEDLFELRIPRESNSYRTIDVLHPFLKNITLTLKVIVFWWLYQAILIGSPIWSSTFIIQDSSRSTRLTFSILYWCMRLGLLLGGIGLMSFIGIGLRKGMQLSLVFNILKYALALILLAIVYRNVLISHFAHRSTYPSARFFLLNIPLVNFIVWIIELIGFDHKTHSNESDIALAFDKLKSAFVDAYRNSWIKILIVLIVLSSGIYQLSRAGLRLDHPSREGAWAVLLIFMVQLAMVIWFLYNKQAYIPLLILSVIGLLSLVIIGEQSLVLPTMASGLVNIVLFYGLFYFDEFHWQGKLPSPIPGLEREGGVIRHEPDRGKLT